MSSTTAVVYVGPFDAVDVLTSPLDPEAPETWAEVAQGDSVDVASDRAESLLEQADNWRAKKAPAKKAPAKKAAKRVAKAPEPTDPEPTTEPDPSAPADDPEGDA